MTAQELLNQAEALSRNNRFGEAINIYREAASATDATDDIRRKALASVELIQEINGFVNVDLLNP
jgi:predicted ATP-grasp superfamily ATP-dependent carboligase